MNNEERAPLRIWVDRPWHPTSAQVYIEERAPNDDAVEYVRQARIGADVRRAMNEACECGGRGPNDDPCAVCDFWHKLSPETRAAFRNEDAFLAEHRSLLGLPEK